MTSQMNCRANRMNTTMSGRTASSAPAITMLKSIVHTRARRCKCLIDINRLGYCGDRVCANMHICFGTTAMS